MPTVEYPTCIVDDVIKILDDATPRSQPVRLYAGEFFNEETLDRLAKDVRRDVAYFVDLDNISEEGPSIDRTPKDRLFIKVYACAANLRDLGKGTMTSYAAANEARRILSGKQIASRDNVHSNGFLRSIGINKELEGFGFFAHALTLIVDIHYNLD